MTDNWRADALCSQVDPELWFPEKGGDGGQTAKALCRTCPVQFECLEDAVASGATYGVWGGTSPRGRQRLASTRRRMSARSEKGAA